MASPLTGDLTVSEILQRWPQTVDVFLRRRMACVGCPIAPFETLTEVSDIYAIDREELLQELRASARPMSTQS